MEDFVSYSPENVIAANLNELDERIGYLCEQELAHLRELALQIVEDGSEASDFIAALPDHRPPSTPPRDSRLSENSELSEPLYRMRSVWKSVLLCSEIDRLLGTQYHIEDFFEDAEAPSDASRGRIVYQRNSYADNAYLRFSELIPEARAVYAHSFGAMCEEVVRGNCEYCILPLENSAEGPLNSFARLIDQYELKIAATCDIPTTDGSRITRFALLRRDLSPALPILKSARCCFEFSLPTNGLPEPGEVLYAASCYGLVCNRVDTRVHRDEGNTQSVIHFSFYADYGNLRAFLLFLSMEAPQYTAIGYYTQLP